MLVGIAREVRDHECRTAPAPGAVPPASTWARADVTLPYVTALAYKGFRRAISDGPVPAKAHGVRHVLSARP